MERKEYHREKLSQVLHNMDSYTTAEYARELLRLAVVASPITLTEHEFTQARIQALSDIANAPEILPREHDIEYLR